ncbi:MAG: hypothetical protein KME29_05090 [Calothrix sp. FI2-JRJ7]|jgi:hypothetical protein|nr:hypothetical protein [Calothrix sp. FI2-JRJ7]
MNHTIYIYALVDPTKNDEIFYVGRTARPKARLALHIASAMPSGNSRNKIIIDIISRGSKPEMRILATLNNATHEEACTAEQAWIDFLGFTCKLTNVCSGRVGGAVGLNQINWTPEMISKLGTKSDPEVALEVGHSRSAVARMRRALGIAPCPQENPRMELPKNIIELMGVLPDREVAKMAGVGAATIQRIRVEMGIPPYREHCKQMKERKRQYRLRRIEQNRLKRQYPTRSDKPKPVQIPAGWNRITLSDEIVEQLGTMPDYKLAEIAGVSKKVIARVRREKGIPSYAATNESKGQFKKGMPHPRWSKKVNAGVLAEHR